MAESGSALAALSGAAAFQMEPVLAVVVGRSDDGAVLVAAHQDSATSLPCDLLRTADAPPVRLESGTRVLVLSPRAEGERGIVLGAVQGAGALPEAFTEPRPDDLLIEAGRSLTLRVGDGSITIREDGKILIKGTDLVSHAKRMNRVRGGSVAIN